MPKGFGVTDMRKQPAREQNVKAITNYFESGIKPSVKHIGIELEHTLVHQSGRPVSYLDPDGQESILEKLGQHYPTVTRDDAGNVTMLSDGRANVTIEPAAQIEVSAGPFDDLESALDCLGGFQAELEQAAGDDIHVLAIGYHPTMRAIDLSLIPKARYQIMNEYLGAISMYGICMMRGSAATQVSIDYRSVDDCLRKMRLANALVPLLALMTDNAPLFEAAPRPHQMMRTQIWEQCDPDRCGTVPGVMEEGFTWEAYAEYILDTPAMVDLSTGTPQLSQKTFGDIFTDRVMTEADVEHALSVFFTDVRLKRYIEIRPADAMAAEYAVAYGALIKGLFYSDESLDRLDEIFNGVTAHDITQAKAALMANGYEGRIYGSSAAALADQLISLAATGLPASETHLLKPLAALVASRCTLADLQIEAAHQDQAAQ